MAGVHPGRGRDRRLAAHDVGAAAAVDVQIDEARQHHGKALDRSRNSLALMARMCSEKLTTPQTQAPSGVRRVPSSCCGAPNGFAGLDGIAIVLSCVMDPSARPELQSEASRVGILTRWHNTRIAPQSELVHMKTRKGPWLLALSGSLLVFSVAVRLLLKRSSPRRPHLFDRPPRRCSNQIRTEHDHVRPPSRFLRESFRRGSAPPAEAGLRVPALGLRGPELPAKTGGGK